MTERVAATVISKASPSILQNVVKTLVRKQTHFQSLLPFTGFQALMIACLLSLKELLI